MEGGRPVTACCVAAMNTPSSPPENRLISLQAHPATRWRLLVSTHVHGYRETDMLLVLYRHARAQ
eukprot:1141918-Rhodomonas_salina.1